MVGVFTGERVESVVAPLSSTLARRHCLMAPDLCVVHSKWCYGIFALADSVTSMLRRMHHCPE